VQFRCQIHKLCLATGSLPGPAYELKASYLDVLAGSLDPGFVRRLCRRKGSRANRKRGEGRDKKERKGRTI